MLGIKREFSLVMHKLLNCHQMIIKCGDSGWKWGRWRGKGRWRIVWASLLAPFEGLSWMLYVWKLLPQTLQVYLCLAASSLNSGSSMAAKRAIYVSEQYVVSYLILFWSIQNLLSKEFRHWTVQFYITCDTRKMCRLQTYPIISIWDCPNIICWPTCSQVPLTRHYETFCRRLVRLLQFRHLTPSFLSSIFSYVYSAFILYFSSNRWHAVALKPLAMCSHQVNTDGSCSCTLVAFADPQLHTAHPLPLSCLLIFWQVTF